MDNLYQVMMGFFGFAIGSGVMVSGFALMMGRMIRAPGSRATYYWGIGGFYVAVGVIMVLGARITTNLGIHLLISACSLYGFYLTLRGYYEFEQRAEPRVMRAVFLALWVIYAVWLFFNNTFVGRISGFTAITLLLWGAIMREVIISWRGRYRAPKAFVLAGLGMIILGNSSRYLGLGNVEAGIATVAFGSPQFLQAASILAPSLLGSVVYSFGLAMVFLYRTVEHTDFTATHDELTGLLNRRAIQANGIREVELAQRGGQALAVAFIDIDFFKQINDRYGHEQGDVALREVAAILGATCRRVDLLGRYGGEEFCMVFPGDSYEGARHIGERLVRTVGEHPVTGLLGGLTISVGMAVQDRSEPARSWESLVHEADMQLYKAKQGGRNRCCMADAPQGFVQGASSGPMVLV